ncbi:MAG: deoxyguanosinetriphosphate triphosphohydrolase [Deltaproteobacteria bacterium]|nr:deoxyguanosinetriphosphate triphosphohydrolase [Deltaproteobacteria bacterium]
MTRSLSQLEQNETQTLAPYAATCAKSLGRQHKEDAHPYRTAFQRDRARIIHTSAFRRLEYKTQVFVNHEGDYYRTRLTHTMEVAQIAKTIARALGLNEDLAESISLAHDLGHTPFGHAGQDVMALLMKEYGGFEHNKQSFRIVTELETPYPQFRGLNLSYEVLEGILKHATEFDHPDGSTFVKEGYPSIEAQLANIADEIAYNNHDLDDGIKSGLISFEILKDVSLWDEAFQSINKAHQNLSNKQIRRLTVKTIINTLVTDLINETSKRIADNGIASIEDVRQKGKGLVGFSDDIKKKNTELKRFLFENMYRHFRVERMATKAQTVLKQLFNAYTQNPKTIPSDFKDKYKGRNIEEHRLICDYIAGMTDRFALEEHSKLFDPFAKV